MNDGLKQRIIGALVLVALAIIFVPVIFDKERITPVDRTTQIPKAPDIEVLPLPERPASGPKREEIIAQPISGEFSAQVVSLEEGAENRSQETAKKSKQSHQEVLAKPKSDKNLEKPLVKASPLSKSDVLDSAKAQLKPEVKVSSKPAADLRPVKNADLWVLQLASFKERERADELAIKVTAMGYRAFVKAAQTKAGQRFRLYVGPSMNKAKLESAKKEIDKKQKLDSLLLRFKP
ncbi:SPOR domain-containing protein [Agaribacterium sp. ZY112]|uniref:SPOR domain-containing protein n=1 Tax=Agaribacterium sp. ZY112 TaxID=3233574 RepID=UPI0035253E7E